MTISGKTNLITEILAVVRAGQAGCWCFLVSIADSGSDLRLAVDANQ